MTKVTFWCDTGASIYSCYEDIFDTVKDLNMAEGEWEGMTDQLMSDSKWEQRQLLRQTLLHEAKKAKEKSCL